MSSKFIKELKVLITLIIVCLAIKDTLVEVYIVPTGSMEETILVGDMLIGSKFMYGMRTPTWIGIPYTRAGFYIPSIRFPKFKDLERNDVTIFEFPRDPFQKYVKRCIGVAGDKVLMNSGQFFVNNEVFPFPPNGNMIDRKIKDRILEFDEPDPMGSIYSYFSGNRDNMREFTVPYRGMEIDVEEMAKNHPMHLLIMLIQDKNDVEIFIDNKNGDANRFIFSLIDPKEIASTQGFLKYAFLEKITFRSWQSELRESVLNNIRDMKMDNRKNNVLNPWEIPIQDLKKIFNKVKVNGTPVMELDSYTLKHDYYFLVGDNRHNSYDSRYWGFVPEYQILGTPVYSVVNINEPRLRLEVVN